MSIFGHLIQYLFDLFNINTTITVNNPSSNANVLEVVVMSVAQILGVLIGGILTYFITKRFNEKADQKQKEYQRRDSYYIPLCTLIENVKAVSYGTDSGDSDDVDSSSIDGEEWTKLKKEVQRYLKAEYRKHLKQSDRDIISKLNSLLNGLDNFISEQEIEGSDQIVETIQNKVHKSVRDFLDKEFSIHGEIEIAVYDNSNIRQFLLLGSLGPIKIHGVELFYGISDKKFFSWADETINSLVDYRNSQFDRHIDDDVRMGLFIHKQISSAISSISTDLQSGINEFVITKHKEIIELEIKILELLNSLKSDLIKEIDRISNS